VNVILQVLIWYLNLRRVTYGYDELQHIPHPSQPHISRITTASLPALRLALWLNRFGPALTSIPRSVTGSDRGLAAPAVPIQWHARNREVSCATGRCVVVLTSPPIHSMPIGDVLPGQGSILFVSGAMVVAASACARVCRRFIHGGVVAGASIRFVEPLASRAHSPVDTGRPPALRVGRVSRAFRACKAVTCEKHN
jgi:hypothetical protein